MKILFKLLLKLIVLPIWLALALAYGSCWLLLFIGNRILGLVSSLIILVAIGLLIFGNIGGGLALILLAFLISPFGIPRLASWLVSLLGAVKRTFGGILRG